MRSAAMRELDRVVRVIAGKDVGVTIIGESGTGKEVLARRVHELSERRRGPFVPINCAAIPESLFESELFGHERGAYTGASEMARGKVEASSGGTLFLDEIAEMPFLMQAKVLRFLEHRKFMRVGGSTKISVDARVVCATLRPLEQEVSAGRFRADLYYRLQGVVLQLPPLRERPLDIPSLVNQFLAELSARHSVRAPKMTRNTLSLLRAYAWPGNVRELKNVIELVCLMRSGKTVRPGDLPRALQLDRNTNQVRTSPVNKEDQRLTVSLDQPLSDSLRQILIASVDLENGNRSRAARRLGVSLRTIQRHLGPERQSRA
jgi:DNA-binding NtrC family response regulator